MKTRLNFTELLLIVVGVLSLGYCGFVATQAAAAKRMSHRFTGKTVEARETTRRSWPLTPAKSPSALVDDIDAPRAMKAPEVIGRLDIPQIQLSVPVLSDYDTDSLLKGVGHIPGTAMPGGLGTVGLAGHRDLFLRPLRLIKPHMDIRLVEETDVYHYQVDSTEIVTPDQVEVLDTGSKPELTLITCYPFFYVGNAPKRFIVHAHLVSALPD